jgi:threonyl-tRNA synthetase
MTYAVKMMHPNVKLGVGPWTDEGFYQDFDFGEETVSDKDFKKIQKKMRWIVNKNFKIERKEFTEAESREIWKDDKYKLELIDGIVERGEQISAYDFVNEEGQTVYRDICAGPHLETTGDLGIFKLTKLAAAYWRGDSDRETLTRIYGVAFETEEKLAEYEHFLEEAAKRDHRKLGQELDLFSFHDEGPGFPFWHPNGMTLMNCLLKYWHKKHDEFGYKYVKTPMMLSEDLWHQSGHYENYKENMYFTEIDEKGYAVKPMNCPGGMLIYKNGFHSYRDLPLRLAELGLVHRHELSGTLHGLFRVRAFTQDDAHIFCTIEQVEEELKGVIKLAKEFYSKFGFEFHVELSTKPDKAIGEDSMWEKAESILEKVIENSGLEFKINPGDGAFYGPKLDFHLKDAIGRTWQCGTVQLDFAMPERFDLTYIGADGEKHRPVMLHRVIFGSIERFIGILIEHTSGALPAWLSPVQAHILPVTDDHLPRAKEVLAKIRGISGRAEIIEPSETLGKRLRNSQTGKIPFSIIIGDGEVESGKLTIRRYGERKDEQVSVDDFLKLLEG